MDFFSTLPSADSFMPHGHCYLWTPSLLWLNIISDLLIALSYFTIPVTLIYFIRARRDIPFNWMFIAFGVFILACGGTHIMDIWTTWNPAYWQAGFMKALTAGASVPTAILLVYLIPKALLIPSPQQLAKVNADLENEIDERQRLYQALQEINIELAKASKAKDRFLASMSHELRTPLNAIIGFTSTLLMKLPGDLNAEQEKQLLTIQKSGRHLVSLINDLLDLAKIESGKVELYTEPVACKAVLDEVGAALKPLGEAKGLAFEIRAPEGDPMISNDRRALTQILLNLANNAIKFTDHGSICIELKQQRRDGEGALRTQFAVQDTGVGIAAEDQARLFQVFEQFGPRGARRQEGTGLGLHLSQKLATLLGGHIEIESKPGKGSCFTLVIEDR